MSNLTGQEKSACFICEEREATLERHADGRAYPICATCDERFPINRTDKAAANDCAENDTK